MVLFEGEGLLFVAEGSHMPMVFCSLLFPRGFWPDACIKRAVLAEGTKKGQ